MSKKRKNFHYHYAEQYETPAERRARARERSRQRARYAVSPVTLIISTALLLVFGLVTMTFSAYVTASAPGAAPSFDSGGYAGLAVSVKNHTVRDEIRSENLNSQEDMDEWAAAAAAADAEKAEKAAASATAAATEAPAAEKSASDKADLANTGAKVDLAETGWNYGGKTVFIKPEGNWKLNNEKYRFRVWGGDGVALSDVATQYSNNTDYYYTTIPTGSHDGGQWVRVNASSTDTIWNYGANWNGTSNAYWDNGSSNSQYNFWPKGTTVYFDGTVNTAWDGYSMFTKDSNSGNTGGNAVTKIADHLYKYTLSSDWDNKSLYWWRGNNASTLWNYTAEMTAFNATIAGKNAVSPTGTSVSNGNGTVAAISSFSLPTPTITNSASETSNTFKADTALTVTVSNNSDVKLHYTFNSGSRTTNLLSTDKIYTLYLDDNLLETDNTSGVFTIAANYFDNTSGKEYGNHEIKVKVGSALNDLEATSAVTTITVKNPSACVVKANALAAYTGSVTVNNKLSIPITTTDHVDGTITVSVPVAAQAYLEISNAENGTYASSATFTGGSGTLWVRGIQKLTTAAVLTAHCTDEDATDATISLTVAEPTVAWPNNTTTMNVNATLSKAVSITPAATTYTSITYTSSNTTNISVDAAGLLTAKHPGSSTITATVVFNASCTVTKTVNVTVRTPSPSYSNSTTSLAVNAVSNKNISSISNVVSGTYTVSYAIEDGKDYFTVNPSTGAITGVKPGTANWIATVNYGNYSQDYTKSIEVNIPTIKIDNSDSKSYSFYYDETGISIGSVTSSVTPTGWAYSIVTGNNDSAGVSSLATLNSPTNTTISGTSVAANVGTAYLKVSATYNGSYTQNAYFEIEVKARPDFYVLGFGSDKWTTSASGRKMTYTGSGYYSVNIWLEANRGYGHTSPYNNDNYGFKVYGGEGSEWYSKSDSSHWYVTGTAATSTGLEMTTGSPNMYIDTTYAGLYTFEFGYNTTNSRYELTVTYPASTQYYLLGLDNRWAGDLSDSEFATARLFDSNGELTLHWDAPAQSFTKATAATGFKVYNTDGTFYGASNYTFTRSNYSTAKTLTNNVTDAYNMGLTTWYSGDYTFKLDTSGGSPTLKLKTVPARTLTAIAKLPDAVGGDQLQSTTLSAPTGTYSGTWLTITDNYNDTFVVTTKAPADNDTYTFSSWSNATVTGTAGTSGTRQTYTVTLNASSSTSATITSEWNPKAYDIIYHTYGAEMDTGTYPLVSGSTDTTTSVTLANGASGSVALGRRQKGEYTYGYGVAALPTVSDFTSKPDSTWTFAGWYDNNGFTGSPVTSIGSAETGTKNYYAKWTVNVTFKDNIDSSRTIDVQTVRIGTNATKPATATVSATSYTGFAYTEAEAGEWSGEYISVYGDQTVYAIYHPVTESITITMTPNEHATLTDGVWELDFGAAIKTEMDLTSAYTSGYAAEIDYYYSLDGSSWTAMTDTSHVWHAEEANVTTLMTNANGNFNVYFKTVYTDVRSVEVVSTDTATYTTKYYKVNTPIISFALSPDQKIFTTAGASSAEIKANFTSYSDQIASSSLFKTKLESFDQGTRGTVTLTESGTIAAVVGESDAYVSDLTSSLTSATYKSFVDAGLKYFNFTLLRNDSETETPNWVVDSVSDDTIHTTVGTSEIKGARPLFFKTATDYKNVSYSNADLMAFYVDSIGSLCYQTGDRYGTTGDWKYRFSIPSGVTNVGFALIKTGDSVRYTLPKVDPLDNSLIFSDDTEGSEFSCDCYYAVTTGYVSLTDAAVQTVTDSGISGTEDSLNALTVSVTTPRM